MKTRITVLTVSLLLGFLLSVSTLAESQCLECHSGWEDEEGSPSALFSTDVHSEIGLGCADCHGGDPELDDMDDVRKSRNYRGVPSAREIPEFCASCHADPSYMVKHNPSLPTDQLEKYKSSVHGQKLLGRGDTKVANCVSCHSVHNIKRPEIPTSTVYATNLPATCGTCHSDPGYMRQYGIPTSQYDDYRASVHGIALLERNDLAAPACNDCHGNHGATPPGVESVSAVCGTCHVLIAEKFAISPHKKAFDENKYPECESCHSNHRIDKPRIEWVGDTEASLCIRCHKPGDGTTGLETAAAIYKSLLELGTAYQDASNAIYEADQKGMMVVDEEFVLGEVDQAMIKAKTMVHTFNSDSVGEVTQEGLDKAKAVNEAGLAKIDDFYFRRKGLGVATLFITLLAVALYVRIKRIEKDQRS